MGSVEMEIRNWRFLNKGLGCPPSCKASHFILWKEQVWLQNVQNEKRSCKACKTTVFHCYICKFVTFCCYGCLSSLIGLWRQLTTIVAFGTSHGTFFNADFVCWNKSIQIAFCAKTKLCKSFWAYLMFLFSFFNLLDLWNFMATCSLNHV